MAFELDLTGETSESLDAFGTAPAGWYFLTVDDVEEDQDRMVFHYRIAKGPFAGSKLRDWLHDPEYVDPEKADFHRRKASMYASRLELINANDAGKRVEIDWTAVVGKEVVGFVQIRASDRGEFNELKMGALFPNLDHPKCPADCRAALRGDPLPEKRGRTSPPAQPKTRAGELPDDL